MQLKKKHKKEIVRLFKEVTTNITEIRNKVLEKFDIELESQQYDSFRRKISRYLHTEGLITEPQRLEDTEEFKAASVKDIGKSKMYMITWEQNETPLHEKFWEYFLKYKDFHKATPLVILGRYKNPTSVHTDRAHETWSAKTRPYQTAGRYKIHPHLLLAADVKTQPTAKYPIRGFSGLATTESVILGHPKLHLQTEPTLDAYPNKILLTTGACTVANYTDSKAGKIAETKHKIGFTVVEIRDDEIFHIRQVEAKEDGSFIDLCYEVNENGVTEITKALGLLGETHVGHLDPTVDKANDLICDTLNITTFVSHDTGDGESVNHWKEKSPIKKALRIKHNNHLVLNELEKVGDWVESKLKYGVVIPRANHNDRYDRALDRDWTKDIHNAEYYMKYTQLALNEEMPKGVLAHYLENRFGDKVRCLNYQDSFKIGKFECSQHLDAGSNGAKGSLTGFVRLGIPMIGGDKHTAYRADDFLCIGTNTFKMLDYNQRGASSWIQSSVIVHTNDTAQHLIFTRGLFTTFEPFQIKK